MSKTDSPPRLLPAIMVTLGVLLGLKAVAFAEGGAAAAPPAAKEAAQSDAEASTDAPTEQGASAAECTAPTFAEAAGLSPSEVQVLQSLGQRREALDARAAEIDTRGELIAAAERRVEERLAELKRLETRVQGLMGQLDDEQNRRLMSLVDVYQRMRAKDAAAVFDALEEDVLLDVATRMRQANLAEIMGKMDPARARRLTEMIARQRRDEVAAATRASVVPIAAQETPAAQTKR